MLSWLFLPGKESCVWLLFIRYSGCQTVYRAALRMLVPHEINTLANAMQVLYYYVQLIGHLNPIMYLDTLLHSSGSGGKFSLKRGQPKVHYPSRGQFWDVWAHGVPHCPCLLSLSEVQAAHVWHRPKLECSSISLFTSKLQAAELVWDEYWNAGLEFANILNAGTVPNRKIWPLLCDWWGPLKNQTPPSHWVTAWNRSL
jgi:hypothetical protein